MVRTLSWDDVEDLSVGGTFLATGGGGDPYIPRLMVKQAMETYGELTLVDASELDPDGLVLNSALLGAPAVFLEKIPAIDQFTGATKMLAQFMGKEPVAIMAAEVGGMNSIIPLVTALELGLPLVDADLMGRAYPQVEMSVFTLAGISATPLAQADEMGNRLIIETANNRMTETLARGAAIALGLANAISCYPVTARQVHDHAVLGSMSLSMELGKRLRAVQRGEPGAYATFLEYAKARVLFTGKVVDLDRRTTRGYTFSTVVLEHADDPSRVMRVEVQNENLVAFEGDRVVASVPDLICMLDQETAQPITTEAVAYGMRLDVIGLASSPKWDQPGMLELVGPRAFGYDIDHVPIDLDVDLVVPQRQPAEQVTAVTR